MHKMFFQWVSVFLLSLIVLTSCSVKKAENQNEIIYQDKVLCLDMPKEEVEALLGEGTFVDELQPGNEEKYIYMYTYDDLEISYYMYHTEKNFMFLISDGHPPKFHPILV